MREFSKLLSGLQHSACALDPTLPPTWGLPPLPVFLRHHRSFALHGIYPITTNMLVFLHLKNKQTNKQTPLNSAFSSICPLFPHSFRAKLLKRVVLICYLHFFFLPFSALLSSLQPDVCSSETTQTALAKVPVANPTVKLQPSSFPAFPAAFGHQNIILSWFFFFPSGLSFSVSFAGSSRSP